MFDVGGGELVLILLAIILLFGPKKIPELSSMLGKGLRELRKAQSEFQSQMSDIRTEINKVAAVDANDSKVKISRAEGAVEFGKPAANGDIKEDVRVTAEGSPGDTIEIDTTAGHS